MSEKLIEDVNQIVNSQLKEAKFINLDSVKKQRGTISLYNVPAMKNEQDWKKVWKYILKNYNSLDNNKKRKATLVDGFDLRFSGEDLKGHWKRLNDTEKLVNGPGEKTHVFLSTKNGEVLDGVNINFF